MYKKLHNRPSITKYILQALQVYNKVLMQKGFKISSPNENNQNICHTLNIISFSTSI